MSGAWVAGDIRARSLLRRRLGVAAARDMASRPALADALRELCAGPYGHDVRPEHALGEAERAVAATLLWHLRVLAGWQPARGAGMIRLLGGWFEIANVVDHSRELAGATSAERYEVGALGTVGTRLSTTTSLPTLRDGIANSVWGDPGAASPSAIAVGLQITWAVRVAAGVPQARFWAAGGVALLVAREQWLRQRRLPEPVSARVRSLLGADPGEFGSLEAFVAALRAEARWALAGVEDPGELWRAESRWWARVADDGAALLRQPWFGPEPVVGAVALLAVDAWRVRAALQIAARGGRGLEVFDELA